jgi:hypothetical protein
MVKSSRIYLAYPTPNYEHNIKFAKMKPPREAIIKEITPKKTFFNIVLESAGKQFKFRSKIINLPRLLKDYNAKKPEELKGRYINMRSNMQRGHVLAIQKDHKIQESYH